jgi:hemoglobin
VKGPEESPGGGPHPEIQYHYRWDQRTLIDDQEVYGLIGEDGFERLVAAFYRQVPGDDILGPMYPADDLPGAEQRLRDFLIFRFGGPQTYLAQRGHPRLRMRHAPFVINQAARDRWMQMMTLALREARLPSEADEVLRAFFESTATFMMNRVPAA